MAQSSMMERLRRTTVLLALALLAGGVAVLFVAVFPFMNKNPVLDPNLAAAVAAPLRSTITNLMVLGALGLVLLMPRRLPTWGLLTALAVAALLLFDRLWLQSRVDEAWARVDRVTGRPLDHLAQAQAYADMELMLTSAVAALVVLLTWCWAGESRAGESGPEPLLGTRPLKTSEVAG